MMNKYISLPGKNEYSEKAKKERLLFLEKMSGNSLKLASQTNLKAETLKGNIESFIGSMETPLGAAGPLFMKGSDWQEWVTVPLATTEGALVSSMTRGAKAISLSGGARVRFISQTMTRVPMFVFKTMSESLDFSHWVKTHEDKIHTLASQASNYAKILKIEPEVFGKFVHLRFFYETADAAGQNMVTVCTWKIANLLMKELSDESFAPLSFYIDGNASTDKKVSAASLMKGRGIKVCAEAWIKEEDLLSTLKVTSEQLVQGYNQSMSGLVFGNPSTINVNIANTVAAIFGATGQDLACVGEASQGQFYVEKTEDGVYISLLLTNLIIGTVGGGTKLAGQREILEFLNCYGAGKVKRFAEIIAGYCLSLDLSTMSAVVAGHFATAHERLGRNRNENWFSIKEIDHRWLNHISQGQQVEAINKVSPLNVDNSLLVDLVSSVSNQPCGFWRVDTDNQNILVKVKPSDKTVLEATGAFLNVQNKKLYNAFKESLKGHHLNNIHINELVVYDIEHEFFKEITPSLWGVHKDEKRDVYILALELLENTTHMNSENKEHKWKIEQVEKAVFGIGRFHRLYWNKKADLNLSKKSATSFSEVKKMFNYWKAIYEGSHLEFAWFDESYLNILNHFLNNAESWWEKLAHLPQTLIHGDFNLRNICFRETGELCVYDWEQAHIGFAQKDILEFFSFLDHDLLKKIFLPMLKYHYDTVKNDGENFNTSWEEWLFVAKVQAYYLAAEKFSSYLVMQNFRTLEFLPRCFKNLKMMIEKLEIEA